MKSKGRRNALKIFIILVFFMIFHNYSFAIEMPKAESIKKAVEDKGKVEEAIKGKVEEVVKDQVVEMVKDKVGEVVKDKVEEVVKDKVEEVKGKIASGLTELYAKEKDKKPE